MNELERKLRVVLEHRDDLQRTCDELRRRLSEASQDCASLRAALDEAHKERDDARAFADSVDRVAGRRIEELKAECARKVEPLSDNERSMFLLTIAGVAIEESSGRVTKETEVALYRWLDRCQGKHTEGGG